jgi:hypothetical protein
MLAFDRTPLQAQSPWEAVNAARVIRDAVVEARSVSDGRPIISDTLICELGDSLHLLDLTYAHGTTFGSRDNVSRLVSRANVWFFATGFLSGIGLFGFLVR